MQNKRFLTFLFEPSTLALIVLNRASIRNILALIIGAAFVNIGIDHFIDPKWYEPLVPVALGSPRFWVLLSGFFEIGFGIFLILPRTREWASVIGVYMLVALYWANFNMWYNDIPLDGTHYENRWHLLRLIIQVILILIIAWLGEITPFKNENKGISQMDVFKGRISSCAFSSGDRVVVGDWYESPLGRFSDVMWAGPDGKRTLIAPSMKVAEYLNSIYSFEETIITDLDVILKDNEMSLKSEKLELNFEWDKGWKIPFKRSLFFIAAVEGIFARILFGTKTHGRTKDNRKEWYAIDRVSKITTASASIDGQDLGSMTSMSKPCKFGFSEAPKKPSSCVLRTHIL